MATEIGRLSLTDLQKLTQSQQNQLQHQVNPSETPNSSAWMWNPNQAQEDDDSWEVRAFAEDTGNIMGTTWPPRSYTCNFCRREFRSAQALGGHMNVHRRDRARLHQTQPPAAGSVNSISSDTNSSSTYIIPTQEFTTNSGLCLLYQLPNPNGVYPSSTVNACSIDSPSTHISISPFPHGQSLHFPVWISSSHCHPIRAQASASTDSSNGYYKEQTNEDLDLELRLGQR